jgi:hypothetical protein
VPEVLWRGRFAVSSWLDELGVGVPNGPVPQADVTKETAMKRETHTDVFFIVQTLPRGSLQEVFHEKNIQ